MTIFRGTARYACALLLGLLSLSVAYAAKAIPGDYTQSDSAVPVKAYIYADHTVLELDSYDTALTINDDSGGTVSSTRDGRYARLDGKLNHFTAYIDGRPVVFTRKGWVSPKSVQADQVALASTGKATAMSAAALPASAALALSSHETVLQPMHSTTVQVQQGGAISDHANTVPLLPQTDTKIVASSSVALTNITTTPNSIAVPARENTAVTGNASADQHEPLTLLADTSGLSISTAAMGQASTELWTVTYADTNLRVLLEKWARSAGWQLSWDIPKDVSLNAKAEYHGTFEVALLNLLQDLQGGDTALAACTYDNNLARIVPSSVVCKRSEK